MERFKRLYPKSKKPIENWLRIVRLNDFKHSVQLKQVFNSVDFFKGYKIFDIGGNNYRLIAVVLYVQGAMRILHVLTHDEYAKGKWRKL